MPHQAIVINSAPKLSHTSVLKIISTLHLRSNHPQATTTRSAASELQRKYILRYPISPQVSSLHNCWKRNSVHKISERWKMVCLDKTPKSVYEASSLLPSRLLNGSNLVWIKNILTDIGCGFLQRFLSNTGRVHL